MTASNQKRTIPHQTNRPGRPPSIRGKATMVYLDEQNIELAARLGDGNISAGIRLALELAGGVSK